MSKLNLSLDFKGSTVYALRLVLYTNDTATLLADLDKRINEAGDFYTGEAVVIDISKLEQAPNWDKLIAAIRQQGLYPIGIQSVPELIAECENSGLPVLDSSKPARQPSQTVTEPTATEAQKTTMIVERPLRSGQSIYAKGSDLIVIGMVSKGAEVIADGNIHVYGPLRGKAIAGARGNTNALILTTQLDPELVAIAGVYRVIETDLPNDVHNQAAKIELDEDTLRIHALN